MSLDPFDSTSGVTNLGGAISDPATDVIIIYGGWGATDGGSPLAPNAASGSGKVLADIQAAIDPPNRQKRVLALQGNLSDMGGVSEGLNFIRRHFHPRGKLIIYGYSAGGTDALALCRAIWREIPNYDCSTQQFLATRLSLWHSQITNPRFTPAQLSNIGWVMVDLVITIDGAAGPFSGGLDRTLPGLVRWNLNFFQTTPSPIRSRGGANSAVDSDTRVRNIDLTGQAEHSTIDELTSGVSVRAVDLVRRFAGTAIPDIPTALAP